MLSAYIRPRRRYHWRRLPVNGIMRSSVSSAASLHLRRYTTPLQCSLTRHFHRYRICLQAATSVYITRQNFIPSNLVFSRDFRTTAIEWLGKNGNKSSRNHQGIDNYCWTRVCVCVCIYIYERRNINNLVVRDSSVGPLIPHSWYGYPRVDPTPLAHQRRHKARSDGANYLFHELPPPTLLPPSPPPARATASLLMLACVYTSRRSPAGAT